jgi:hypothetical protein
MGHIDLLRLLGDGTLSLEDVECAREWPDAESRRKGRFLASAASQSQSRRPSGGTHWSM